MDFLLVASSICQARDLLSDVLTKNYDTANEIVKSEINAWKYAGE